MHATDYLQRMQQSNIPPFAMASTLVTEGFPNLRAIVQSKEYKTSTGRACYRLAGGGSTNTSSRSIRAVPPDAAHQAARICAVMAKELVLQHENVVFMPLAGMFFELSESVLFNDDRGRLAGCGMGYIVIPDFDNEESIPDPASMARVADYLMTHVSLGGGLILGQHIAAPLTSYGPILGLLDFNFTEISVERK